MHQDIEIGSLITTYNSGYFILTRVEDRSKWKGIGRSTSPLYHYRKVLDGKGNPVKSKKEQSCDASWCKLVTSERIETDLLRTIQEAQDLHDAINGVLPGSTYPRMQRQVYDFRTRSWIDIL